MRLLVASAMLCLSFFALGCGGSDSSTGETKQTGPTAEEKQLERETRQVKQELKKGDFVDCGAQVFVNKRIFCAFAKNMRHAYYVEVVSGSGKVIGLHPSAGKDYRVHCSGTVPHRCTGFKGDGIGIEPLKGALIFFSP